MKAVHAEITLNPYVRYMRLCSILAHVVVTMSYKSLKLKCYY